MADRYVRIDIFSKGADQVKKDFDDLKKDADELKGPHDVNVGVNDTVAKERMDALKLQLGLLKKEGAEIPLTVKNDKFNIQILDARAKIDELSKKAADPKLDLNTDRFHAQVIKAKLDLDSLQRKADKMKLLDKGSLLGTLLDKLPGLGFLGRGGGEGGGSGVGGALGEAGGSGASGSLGTGLLSSLAGASNAYTGAALAGLAGLAGSLIPALGPFALGGGAGLGGILAAYLTGHKKGLLGIESTGKSTLNYALSSEAPKPHGGLAPGSSFLDQLSPLYAGIDRFIKGVGPGLAETFRASIPFITALVNIMTKFVNLMGPAMTQSMKELTPFLPQIVQGFKFLSQGIADFILDLGPGMKDSVTVFKALMDAVKGILIGLAFTADGLAIAFAHIGNWARNTATDVHNRWDELRHATANVFDGIRHDIVTIWDDIWKSTIGRLVSADRTMVGLEMGWRHDIANTFDGLRHDVATSWDHLWSDIGDRLRSGEDNAMSDLRNWWHTITSNFDTLRHTVTNTWSIMWNDVKNMTRDAVRGVSTAIHGIEGAFRTPVAFVVNDVWDKLAGVWNKIAGIVHLSSLKLPVVHMAGGGKVSGGSREGADDVPALIGKNETVVSADHSRALAGAFRAVGVPGYAAGGLPNPQGVHTGLQGTGPTGFSLSSLMSWVTKPFAWLENKLFGGILDLAGKIPGGTAMSEVLDSLTKSLVSSLTHSTKTSAAAAVMTGKYKGKYGSGVMQWQGDVFKALAMEGLGKYLASQVLYQMQTESGGNPNAINLTDSNAAAGDPSRGLLQTIMTTFRAYHWPGTSWDIYNPLANIAAAINYARHVYGPTLMRGGMGMGSGHGYAAGGWIREPVIGTGMRSGHAYSFGEMGPEYVSPAGRYGGGGGGDIYNIMVAGDTDPDGAALRIIQEIRRYKKKHGNQATGIG